MKILLIQDKNFINGSGGTEKICCFLANTFSAKRHNVEIATNENIEGKAVFELNPDVKVTNIYNPNIEQVKEAPIYNYSGRNPFLWMKYKIQKKLTKRKNKLLIKRNNGKENILLFNLQQRSKAWEQFIKTTSPDLIITMSINSLVEITYSATYSIPIINSVNGRPDYDYTDVLWHRSNLEMKLLEDSYRHFSGIQVLFDDYQKYLPKTFRGKCKTIPNPVPQFNQSEIVCHGPEKDMYKIIHIGTLANSCKQQETAINVFAELAQQFPLWNLEFWGTGTDYDFLNNIIKEKQLQDRIFLKGFTNQPIEELKKSDIFIFPSQYEGFPLALTEAMSIGLPSIGFSYCSGVNALIKDNFTGFLVENQIEMQQKLEELMKDFSLRESLGKNAHLEMKQFDETTISQQWIDFIESYF